MIEIKNITKKFGQLTAIENINLKVKESSIYGLVGYNGAGKTTLLKVCAGIYKPDGGEVLMDGINVYDNPQARREMFFVPDDLYFNRTANLDRMRKFYKGYYPNFSDKVYCNMVNAMGLDVTKNISSFSKGMKRQAELVLAMASMPKYLLLDECFDGIDPQKRNMLKKIFLEYLADSGCSMIMSSHNLQEVSNICDNVALINGKKVTMDVNVDDVNSAYKKYRIFFKENPAPEMFAGIANKHLEIDGTMVQIIVSSDFDEGVFRALNPIHIDSITLSLEEVFLNEMEDNKYDIKKIFS